MFPVTYVLSDVFSEVYGYKWSRTTCYMAFAMNVFMVISFTAVNALPTPPEFDGSPFLTVLGNTPKALFASLLGYVVGDFLNDNVFRAMKSRHGEKRFALRAILSSVIGEFADSIIFISVMFAHVLPWSVIATMIFAQAALKISYEIIIVPLTSLIAKALKVKEEEGENEELEIA